MLLCWKSISICCWAILHVGAIQLYNESLVHWRCDFFPSSTVLKQLVSCIEARWRDIMLNVDPYDIALLWFCAVPKLISPIIRSATVFIYLSSYEHEGSPSVWDKICTNIAAETLRLAVSETNLRKALCIYDEDSMRNLIKKEKDSLSLEFMRRCKFWQAKAL